MILADFSSISIVTYMGFLHGNTDAPIVMSEFRNLVLRQLLEYHKKYHKRFGELIICTDGNDYWRRKNFPFYKGSRKKSKDESGYDWKAIKQCQMMLADEIRRFLPYPVISVPCAEADDSIAILAEWSQTNDLDVEGLFETPKDLIVISGDEDFVQLQKYKNVKQFSPMTKKQVGTDMPLAKFCLEHVLSGDSSDGIPSIVSPLDFYYQKELSSVPMRQKSCTAGIKKFYYDQLEEHGEVTMFRSPEEEYRFRENEGLVLFSHIPQYVKDQVLTAYKSQLGKGRTKVMDYFVAARLKNLIGDIQDL